MQAASDRLDSAFEAAKPSLRGVSHQFAFFFAIAAAVLLVRLAPAGAASLATAAFGVSLVTLFGVSALYHRRSWSEAARMRMRRLDHSAIFVLIAGGYTPLFTVLPGAGHRALIAVWLGAAVGVVKSIAWPKAPKWVTALLAVGLGWLASGEVLARASHMSTTATSLLVASGGVYSLGALVYAKKRPDPYPLVFGYHEVFHALVIVASILLCGHVALVVHTSA
ncbi:MAG: hemolysin III family protein [Myxococcales bacterium]|nr:hemolysin III family protein [Myxococcales bacterium]